MKNNKLTIAELAALTRDMRTAVQLPGVPTSQETEESRVMAELKHWDSAENILATLKGRE